MINALFLEISLVIGVAAIVAALMRAFKQPLIIGHILTGLIVGPYILNVVHSTETVDVFSNLGIALLLFIIGLGLNPRVIKEVGRVAVLTGFIQVFLTAAMGFGLGKLLGFSDTSSAYLAVALTFSSTIIILKLLSDKKELSRLYGKVSTGFLLTQDLIATLVLIAVAATGSGGVHIAEVVSLALRGLLLLGALVFVSSRVLPRLTNFLAATPEFLFLFAIAWGFGLSSIFLLFGFSLEIGALVAGVSLASLPYAQEVGARLRPLRDFFIILFFIALGMRAGLENLLAVLPVSLLLSAFVLTSKPLIVMTTMGLLGYTKKTSFKTSLAVAQISEFSLILIILANQLGHVGQREVSIVTLVAIITIAISTYMILYTDWLYLKLEPKLRLFERRKLHTERQPAATFDIILFGYKKGGRELVNQFKKLGRKYLVVDYDPEVIDMLEQHNITYAYGDATDSEFLEEIGLDQAKIMITSLTDYKTNLFLVHYATSVSNHIVSIVKADSNEDAADLYEAGATYVMMPHYVGSERITSLLKRYKVKKDIFKKVRQKHLEYLEHFS